MDKLSFALIVILLVVVALAFVWVATRLGSDKSKKASLNTSDNTPKKDGTEAIGQALKKDVEDIFTEEYREELKNKGRLHFEKVIGENAEFLHQDIRLVTSQISEFMKQEITKTLQEEFSKYEQAIEESKQIALDSIKSIQSSLDDERKAIREKIETEANEQRQAIIAHFEKNMSEIVNHYILDAIGTEIDLSNQITYIIGSLQDNKDAIIQDINNGA